MVVKPIKKDPLRDFYQLSEHKPLRQGTYRVYTIENVFTASYWNGRDFEVEVSHWANRKK